jgi:hypothetical protein
MRRLGRIAAAVAVTGVALGALPGPALAGRPDMVLDVGRTLAVKDGPGGGGLSFGVSALWPIEDHFRVGMMGFVDGLGERTDRLIGAGGEDLGPIAGVHRAAQGAALRLEAHAPAGRRLRPYLAATWGFYRVEDDVRGTLLEADDAVGFGLGLGLMRDLSERHAAGVAVRAQQLSRGGGGRYLTAALEWRWSTGAAD